MQTVTETNLFVMDVMHGGTRYVGRVYKQLVTMVRYETPTVRLKQEFFKSPAGAKGYIFHFATNEEAELICDFLERFKLKPSDDDFSKVYVSFLEVKANFYESKFRSRISKD